MEFFEKWDPYHLHKFADEKKFAEMMSDLESLKSTYNFIYEERVEDEKPYITHFSFYRLAEWSKQKPRKAA